MRKSHPSFRLFMGIVDGVACLGVAFLVLVANGPRIWQLLGLKTTRCSVPPDGFSEKDLIGTWVHPGINKSDTLIIRGDRTYKQIIHIDHTTKPDVDYEGDWQSWWLEYKDGIPYLHLEGMRLCAINTALSCDHPGGRAGFNDFCRNEAVHMDNEGILLVLGVPKENQSPNDHRVPTRWVILFVPMGSENTWAYTLQEP